MEDFMRRQAGGAGTPGAEGPEAGGASEAELQERAKRKGRFRYVEDDYAAGGAQGAAPSSKSSGVSK
jgi:hypothetical protein